MKKIIKIILIFFLFNINSYANEENNFYNEYLKKCSNSDIQKFSLKEEVTIFSSSNLKLDCLEKEFLNHLNNFPVISWANDNNVPFDNVIIRNNQKINNGVAYENITTTSLYSQLCGEQCVFSDEVIIIYKDKYWYIRGMNDKGVKGFLINNEVIQIQNHMTTHVRNYIFNIKEKKFTPLPNGGLKFNKDYILVEGQKSYFEPMGAFWFNSKINYSGEIIELISDGNTCEPPDAFRENIQLAMKKMGLNEFCVTTY